MRWERLLNYLLASIGINFAFVDITAEKKLNLDIIAILYEHELNKALECQKSGRKALKKKVRWRK